MDLSALKEIFENYLHQQIDHKQPVNLYRPIQYTLENGGKRIRPILVLLAAKSFGVDLEKALPAAAAIEIFHNFTLLHDDIMDDAPLRRGKPTVHQKWDENTAILSGDTMLILAYKMLEAYEGVTYKQLNMLLNKTAVEVCEGQQMDMDFEERDFVPIDEYIEMIRLKTAVLLGAALKFGGIIAQVPPKQLSAISRFGEKLGLAFQIQDDYLDSFGDMTSFGKRIGGDILDRKKTFLYLTALSAASPDDRQKLLNLYSQKSPDNQNLIAEVMAIFKKYAIDKVAQKAIETYTGEALEALEKTGLTDGQKDFWSGFATELMNRAV